MYGGLGMSAPSLHRKSTDSLIHFLQLLTSEMLKHCGVSVSERCGFSTTELTRLALSLTLRSRSRTYAVFHGLPPVYPSLCAYSGVVPFRL